MVAACTRIKLHVDELRQWADEMTQLRDSASEYLQRDDVREALASDTDLDATLT